MLYRCGVRPQSLLAFSVFGDCLSSSSSSSSSSSPSPSPSPPSTSFPLFPPSLSTPPLPSFSCCVHTYFLSFFSFIFVLRSTAIPEHLWAEFQNHSLSVLRQLPPDDERLKEIPPQFYAAFPLDSASKTRGTAGSFGYPSDTYKVRHGTRVRLCLYLFCPFSLMFIMFVFLDKQHGNTRRRAIVPCFSTNVLVVCHFMPDYANCALENVQLGQHSC